MESHNNVIHCEDNTVNLLNPESCILDCNKGEKLIIEMNNHICLGEYELARTFFKQILEVVPKYIEYFYKIILTKGIPDKWLLSNNLRTSANYLWILIEDYKNELQFIKNSPYLKISEGYLNSLEFDLLITTAFYNSYELEIKNFEINFDFLKDLRYIYNKFACIRQNLTTLERTKELFVPKLRILSPYTKQKKGTNLFIKECIYKYSDSTIFDDSYISYLNNSKTFIRNFENFIISQPLLSKKIIEKILDCIQDISREDTKKIQEVFHIIYVNLIMIFIKFKDYVKVYEYLKYIPYNSNLKFCRAYVMLLFSVIIGLLDNNNIEPSIVVLFTQFVVSEAKLNNQNKYINEFKNLPFFDNKVSVPYYKETNLNYNKDIEKSLLKYKIYESLLGNINQDIIKNMNFVEDLYIKFQKKYSEIPVFFKKFYKNLEKNEIFTNLSYEELNNIILNYSKQDILLNDIVTFSYPIWKKTNYNIFWNDYLNFLRNYNEHCLGYVLKESIEQIKNFKFSDTTTFKKLENASILLHPLNNLKLLLILFSWQNFENDIKSRKEILNFFWKSYLKYKDNNTYSLVSYFEDIVITLNYIIKISIWINKKIKVKNYSIEQNEINIAEDLDANQVYSRLITNSVPFVLKCYLNNFNFSETSKYFIDNFPYKNQKLQKCHFHDSMIIFSYYFYSAALKRIEEYINSNENTDFILFSDLDIKEMLKISNKILLFPYRLNLINDIYNLIFIKIKDNNNNNNNDFNNYSSSENSFRFHKKVFLEIMLFIKLMMKPIEEFNIEYINNAEIMFNNKYLDDEICNMIKEIENKQILLEDLQYIDSDYLAKSGGLSYKQFLTVKYYNLVDNVNEIIFRFNITNNNPWLEIIYDNNRFLSTIIQQSYYYLQIAKKFQSFNVTNKLIDFFKLEKENYCLINLQEYFILTKSKLLLLNNKQFHDKFNGEEDKLLKTYNEIIDFEKLRFLIIECKEFEDINFKIFKFIFDLSLIEDNNNSAQQSKDLLNLCLYFLSLSKDKNNFIYEGLVNKYKYYIENNNKNESLINMIVSINNLENETGDLKIRNKISLQREALKALSDKIAQPDSNKLPYNEIKHYFQDAQKAVIDSEIGPYNNMNNKLNFNSNNYLITALNYLIELGDIYYQASYRYKGNGPNYLKLLKKDPNEIIAILFLKYQSEFEALKVAKMTKTDLISVILEFTEYFKKSIIASIDFNNSFQELINNFENETNKINNNHNNNKKILNLNLSNNLIEEEKWIKNSYNNKNFKLNMRILQFFYSVSKDNNNENKDYYYEFGEYIPLFISLYRIDFDSLIEQEQVEYWEYLFKKYLNKSIVSNYIKMMFTKFYLFKTFNGTNSCFKHLYSQIREEANYQNNEDNINDRFETYKKINIKINESINDMLPKTYNYIPTTNEYISKLKLNVSAYLASKIKNSSFSYKKDSKIQLKYNESEISSSCFNSNTKFTQIQDLNYNQSNKFYEDMCIGLLIQKNYDLAFNIADKYLDYSKTLVVQMLLKEIVKITDQEEVLFKLLIRITDKVKRAL